jgi:hypothetical protein
LEVLQAIRDVAVIFLALLNIVVLAAVLILMWQLWKLVGVAKSKFEQLTDSANGIVGTVKDTAETVKSTAESAAETAHTAAVTANYVSDRTARPVIELYAAIAGASRFARAVFGSHRTEQEAGRDGAHARDRMEESQ